MIWGYSMDWVYMRQIMRIFLGVCLLLASAGILLFNVFFVDSAYDHALGFLNLFVFLAGLFLTVFNAAKLLSDK